MTPRRCPPNNPLRQPEEPFPNTYNKAPRQEPTTASQRLRPAHTFLFWVLPSPHDRQPLETQHEEELPALAPSLRPTNLDFKPTPAVFEPLFPRKPAKMSVRNLRAMFENKTQESPPDRGRSPGVSSSANESACLFCPSQLFSSFRLSLATPLYKHTEHATPNSYNTFGGGSFVFLHTHCPNPLLTSFLCTSRHRVTSSPFQGPHELRCN